MDAYIGNTQYNDYRIGNNTVKKLYRGDTLIWEKYVPAPEPTPYEIWYTTSDGNTVTPSGLSPTSNVYSDGKGVMTFSSPVTSIPDNCFANQETLTTVTCSSAVTALGATIISMSNVTAFTCEYAVTFDHHTLMDAPKLVSYKNNILTAPSWIGMFERCYDLQSVELTGMTTIRGYCFADCSSLSSITLGATPPTIDAILYDVY